MRSHSLKFTISLTFLLILQACGSEEQKVRRVDDGTKPQKVEVPAFDPDSAFAFIQKQVAFGPRVPNTEPHRKCAEYLRKKLEGYGAEVLVQKGTVKAYNGDQLKIRNIIGQFSPVEAKRVLLFAHWDTRPMADRGEKKRDEPIDGANDGASGVGVLLEIARHLDNASPGCGIDIIFFDAEDHGQPEGTKASRKRSDTWCLGSQYWAKNPPIPNYAPQYGILLDMVGAEDAVFPREAISMQYASGVVKKVWRTAAALGYSNYFVRERIGPITDDHVYVNRIARIPSVNIVHYDPQSQDFGSFHHTHADNLDLIHKPTLKAVGQTVMEVIYRE